MTREELIQLRRRLGQRQIVVARMVGIERTRFNFWECGHIALTPEEIARVQAYLVEELEAVKALDIPTRAVGQ